MLTNISCPAYPGCAARQEADREGERGGQAQHPDRCAGRLPQQRHPPPLPRHLRHEPPPDLIRRHQQKTVTTQGWQINIFMLKVFQSLKMFARTSPSTDVMAETIADLIHHYNLTSLKMIGTGPEFNGNHVALSKRIIEEDCSFSLCTSMIE